MATLMTKSEVLNAFQCDLGFLDCAIEANELEKVVVDGVVYFRKDQIEDLLNRIMTIKPREGMHIVEVRLGREL